MLPTGDSPVASSGCVIEVRVSGCGLCPSPLESWVVKVEVFWFGRADFCIFSIGQHAAGTCGHRARVYGVCMVVRHMVYSELLFSHPVLVA